MEEKATIDLKSLIVAIVLGFLITAVFGFNSHPLYSAIIIFICYLCLICLQNQYNDKKETFDYRSNERFNNNNNNNNNTYPHKSFRNKHNKKKKGNSPLDGLFPKELSNRLNYLYYATSHPFKPKSYIKFKLDEENKNKNKNKYDLKAPKSLKHIQIAKYDYPTISQDQINYNDCMNHTSGNLLSCNQGDNIHASLLTNGISNKKELGQVVREDFSPPEYVNQTKNNIKSLFESSPYDVKYNTPKDYSDDMCSNCSVTESKNANYLL